MAFKTVEGTRGNAISVDAKNKTISGYLLPEVDVYKAKGKRENPTVILHLQSADKTGKLIRLFANYSIGSAVLEKDNTVKKAFLRKLCRFTWLEKVSIGKGKSMNRVKVEVDTAKSAPKLKENVPF